MTRWFLTIDAVLVIRGGLIAETGDPPVVRDLGSLESAMMRPQMGYGLAHLTGLESRALGGIVTREILMVASRHRCQTSRRVGHQFQVDERRLNR